MSGSTDAGLPAELHVRTAPQPALTRYPPKAEDWVRAALALGLLALLFVEVCTALWVVVVHTDKADSPIIENLKSVLTLVLSPTVALFGAATGFYYGTKTEEAQARTQRSRSAASATTPRRP